MNAPENLAAESMLALAASSHDNNGGDENVLFANDLSEALKMMHGLMGDDEDDSHGEFEVTEHAMPLLDAPTEVEGAPPVSFLRGSTNDAHRSLQLLTQDGEHDGKWDCLDLDIVDACRGTSVSKTYRGNFKLFDGKCKGDFVDGLPIYVSSDKPNKPLYIYALGVYDETWSVAALRGLTRWRIVSFQNFDDKTSCRVESANIFQIEFAADGQPYNYYPTIYCFDENGNDFSGFKSSTINIRCNDKADTIGGEHTTGTSGGVIAGVIIGLIVLIVAGYFLWKRYKEKGSLCPPKSKNYDDDDYDSRYPQSRASDSRFSRFTRDTGTRESRYSRDTGTRDSRYSRDTGTRDSRDFDSRDLDEYVDEAPLKSKPNDSHLTKTSDQTPDTVFVPTIEELSEPSYVDEVIEDPISDLKSAPESTGGGPGKLKIPDMFSKFAPKQKQQDISSPPSPKPMQIEPQSEPDSPSRPQTRPDTMTPIPAPSGHVSNSRYMPEKQPSRSAVSKDITDIVEKIDQELDEAISSADDDTRSGGRRSRGYGSGASTSADDERSDYDDRRRDAPPKRRPSNGFGSSGRNRRPIGGFASSEHNRRQSSGFATSAHNRSRSADGGRKKDPFMDLSRRSKFKAIQRNFSDKSKALGRNLADSAEKLKERATRSRSEERGGRSSSSRSLLSSSSGHNNRNDRSRSMERWANANKNLGRSRSQSRECSNHGDRRGRSQSRERSNHGGGGGTRGLSKERSRAAEIFANRNRSRSQSKGRSGSGGYGDRNRSRSRSTDRSSANNFADRNRSSRGKSSSQHTPKSPGHRDRMSASDHTGNRRSRSSCRDKRIGSSSDHSGKPTSDGWATAGQQAQKRRERPRSPERSRHDYRDRSPSPYKEKNRSLSQERAGAENFANRKGRTSSPSSLQRPRNPSFSNPLESAGSTGSTKGRGNVDASQLGRTVTKNEDGSITVAVKRTREDGAIVTTRTKYANVGLARRHGVEVD